MQFVDFCTLRIKAGNGGDGALAWRRESHCARGGPFGGNGGNGGDVVLIGDNNVNTLFHLRNLKQITAANGENGASKICHGAKGVVKYVQVPCGTVVTNLATGEKIFDITYHGQTQLLCKGGKGGKGNFYFKSSINQAPSLWERGDIGESLNIKLEIQSIADVGLLGFPNAGKSTLLSQISNAKPKIASYPFTTLVPVLGIVEHNDTRLVFADIPGLIENAAEGEGLGHDFLKHLNRCKVLLHLVSLDQDENNDPAQAYLKIEKELKKYSLELFNKPQIVVLNKADLEHSSTVVEELIAASKKDVYLISAKNKKGINELLDVVFATVAKIQSKLDDEILEINIQNFQEVNTNIPLKIESDSSGWNITHPQLAYWVHKIPQNTIDNQVRLKQKFFTLKLEESLLNAGAKKGDTVNVHGLTWSFLTNTDYE